MTTIPAVPDGTTELGIDEVVARIEALVRARSLVQQ